MAKNIRISITSALNAAGIEATKKQVDDMAKRVGKAMGEASGATRTHWADIKAAWDMGVAGIRKAWQGLSTVVKSAFKFETQTTQFKTLIGNIDEAKRHMKDLKELGDTPPFSLDEFAKASRSLMVMTDGALGYKQSLELIGDAAAATGQPIENMGHAVGRLYAFIRDGEPLSRATMELRNMGVITPEVASKLQELQEAGADNATIWAEVEAQLKRYNGAMAETEKTGEGLMGAIKSRWDNVVRIFGQAFQETAKDGMGKFLEAAKNLEESGTLEVWADKAGRSLQSVVSGIKTAIGWAGKLVDAYKWVQDKGAEIGAAAGAMAGTLWAGGSLEDAANAGYDARRAERKERKDLRKEEAELEAKIVAQVEAKHREEKAKKDAEAEQRAADEKLRIAKNLADGQAKIREKADKKAAEKAAKEELKAKIETLNKLHAERMKQIDKEIAAAKKEANELEKNAARARGKSFGDWQRGERDLARQKRTEDGQNEKNIRAAQNELKRLEERQRRSPRSMTRGQRERMARLREFLIDQDPKNNPALKKAQELEAKKQKLAEDTANGIKDIKKILEQKTGM